MSRRDRWRENETRIISVTPVSRGVVRPVMVMATTLALIVVAGSRYTFVHSFEGWLVLLFVGPLAVVSATRIWRWRSHKVHVTSARVVLEGGVLRRQRTAIEMRDILATRVVQRVSERLTRRGFIFLETAAGPVAIGLVRYPGALCRIIDAERESGEMASVPLDTVYTYDDPGAYELHLRPDSWQRRRYE